MAACVILKRFLDFYNSDNNEEEEDVPDEEIDEILKKSK